jgi:hypothetical protein
VTDGAGLRARVRQVPWLHDAYRRAKRAGEKAFQEVQIAALRLPSRRPIPSGDQAGLIVSLTSFPARIDQAWIPIERVLRGDQTPDLVVLVLAEEEFPDREVPDRIRRLERRGLQVLWTPRNTHAYKKLVPTRLAYPEATLVAIDDDAMYEPWMLARLVAESHRSPGAVIGHRGWALGHDADGLTAYGDWRPADPTTPSELVLLTGVGGILYPPGVLPIDLLSDLDLALELAPTADDIWCWALERVSRTPVRCLGLSSYQPLRRQDAAPRLQDVNLSDRQNERQIERVIEHFGIDLPPTDRRP